MRMPLASLTNRIFMAAALLVVVAIGCTAAFVGARVTVFAEGQLQRGLAESGSVVERQSEALSENFALLARLTADLPKLKAAVATGDGPTVQPLAEDYQRMIGRAASVVVTDRGGRLLASAGPVTLDEGSLRGLLALRADREAVASAWPISGGVLQVVSVPITIGGEPVERAGTLSLGFVFDAARAAEFRAATGSEIAFGIDGRIRAATLPAATAAAFEAGRSAAGDARVTSGGEEYLVWSGPLGGPSAVAQASGAAAAVSRVPFVVVARSRTAQLRFLGPIRAGIAVTVVVAVLLATVLSYGVARTVTRPLAAITRVMREVAATGDLTRRIRVRPGVWEDEDARLLASSFNTLTESIARFEREAVSRERLSSLGRMSSVVAHEIRNPLMIIKTAARTLRTNAAADVREEALQDIDSEVTRLNAIVNDVLDYAKPLTFAWQPVDANEICRDAVRRVESAGGGVRITFVPDPDLAPLESDADRLRIVITNVLANAADAVRAAGGEARTLDGGANVECRTGRADGGGALIAVRDTGAGMDPQLLPRIFEPYFTTRRTGTGLGLAIVRNIIDGLGGSIAVESAPGEGTVMRIALPAGPPAGEATHRGRERERERERGRA